MAAMTDSVRELIFDRPSETMQTTTCEKKSDTGDTCHQLIKTHLFPTLFTPRLAPLTGDQVLNVLHDTTHSSVIKSASLPRTHRLHSPTEQLFILVVHGHDDEQLRLACRFIHCRTECISLRLEIVGVACSSRVPAERQHNS